MSLKAKNQRKHARRRAIERFDLFLTETQYRDLCLMVRRQENGKSVFLRRQSNRVTIWALFYEGKWLPVVYDSSRKQIASILPDTALPTTLRDG